MSLELTVSKPSPENFFDSQAFSLTRIVSEIVSSFGTYLETMSSYFRPVPVISAQTKGRGFKCTEPAVAPHTLDARPVPPPVHTETRRAG